MSPRARLLTCSACGETFLGYLTRHGRWPRTCSQQCRISAMRRYAEALIAKANELEAREDA